MTTEATISTAAPELTPPAPPRSIRDTYAQVMKALGDPTRLEMLALIGSEDEYPCTKLAEVLPVGKSTISYHVKALGQVGLISVRRQGRRYFYTLHRDVLDFYAPGLLERLGQDAE